MTACPTQETLRQLLACELEASESRVLSDHLAGCPTCQQSADAITNDVLLQQFRGEQRAVEHADLTELRQRLYALTDELPTIATYSHGNASDYQPRSLGRYDLREKLGAGGYGVVFRAEDTQLHRTVALKLPRPETLADPQSRARFLNEARAVAGLRHPQIVALYDAGEADGICYLASAYTPGPTLAKWFAERHAVITSDEAAWIVWALSDAVQHAHENGVLHRDIKPQNVLLDPSVDFHGLSFSPKLTDFGIAKLANTDVNLTLTGQLLGTPRYMAPELASGQRGELGPTLDVYSLGVVLYELLTGRAPIEGDSHADALRRLVVDEPRPLRQLRADVPRDLEVVCLKCLEKDPHRRYQTAQELSEELQRYLRREPTRVRPLGPVERLTRWAHRHPAVAGLIAVTLTAVLLAVIALVLHTRQLDAMNVSLQDANTRMAIALEEAEKAKANAESSDNRTQLLLYVSDMRLAGRAREKGDFREINERLLRHAQQTSTTHHRGIEWRFLKNLVRVQSHPIAKVDSDIYYVCVSPDRRHLATAGKDATLRIYDLATRKIERTIATGQGEVNGLAYAPDGKSLATAGDDGAIVVWDLANQTKKLQVMAHPKRAYQVAFSQNGATLVSCGHDNFVQRWDANTGESLGKLEGQGVQQALAVSPDGQLVASAQETGELRIWEVVNGQQRYALREPQAEKDLLSVVFSQDGRWVITGGVDQHVLVWSLETGQLIARGRHLDAIHSIAISPNGRRLASSDNAGMVYVWELEEKITGKGVPAREPLEMKCVHQWHANPTRINAIAFTSDEELVTGSSDGAITVWTLASRGFSMFEGSNARLAVFTFDNRLMALLPDNRILSWDLKKDPQLIQGTQQELDVFNMTVNRDGTLLATYSLSGAVRIYDLTHSNPESLSTCAPWREWSIGSDLSVRMLQFSHDDQSLAILTGSPQRNLRVFDVATRSLQGAVSLAGGSGDCFAYSPDGQQFAARMDDELVVWAKKGMSERNSALHEIPGLMRVPRCHNRFVCMAYSPNGAMVATGGSDRLIKLWDTRNATLSATLSGSRGSVDCMSFTRDGRSLITCHTDGSVKIWNMAAREELFDLFRDESVRYFHMALSPNERWLACTCNRLGDVLLIDLGELPAP